MSIIEEFDQFIDRKTLVTIVIVFFTIIGIGLSVKATRVTDPPKCGPTKDVNGETEQICVDQYHYISLFEKYFGKDSQ